jgi:membrane peptidoglycan carboxypeptidase
MHERQEKAQKKAEEVTLTRRQFLRKTITWGVGLPGGLALYSAIKSLALKRYPQEVYDAFFERIGANDIEVHREIEDKGQRLMETLHMRYQMFKEGTSSEDRLSYRSRDGHVLKEIESSHISINEVPEALRNTLTLLEDKRILEYIAEAGVDPTSFFNAFAKQILDKVRPTHSAKGGGSNLLQQAIKNLLYTQEEIMNARDATDKAAEIPLATMAQRYIKDLIIADNPNISKEELQKEITAFVQELYVNSVQFKSNIYGLKKACQYYWGKEPSELNAFECLVMATLPNRPGTLSTSSTAEDFRNHAQFTQFFLKSLQESEPNHPLLTPEVQKAIQTDISAQPVNVRSTPLPDRADPMTEDFFNYLALTPSAKTEGMQGEVTLSLDYEMQRKLHEIIEEHFGLAETKGLDTDIETEDTDTTEKKHKPGVDVIIRDSITGEIFALSGWMGDTPVGSIIKPFLCAREIDSGRLNHSQTFPDTPTDIHIYIGDELKIWHVENYGGNHSGQQVNLGHTLAQSLNPPIAGIAARAGPLGVQEAYRGFDLVEPPPEINNGIMSALGGKPASNPARVAAACASLSTNGRLTASTPVIAIKDPSGKTVYTPDPKKQSVVSPTAASLIVQYLSTDSNFPATEMWRPLRGASKDGIPFYSKTGTPDNQRSVWCMMGTLPHHTSDIRPLSVVVRIRYPEDQITSADPTGLKDAAPLARAIVDAFSSYTG